MVRPLFYRTDSHRSGLEDVKRRWVKGHGTRAAERRENPRYRKRTRARTDPRRCRLAFFHASPVFTRAIVLAVSHRALYNRLMRAECPPRPDGRPGGCAKIALNWKTRKSDQALRLSFHFWYYFAQVLRVPLRTAPGRYDFQSRHRSFRNGSID